MPDLLEHVEPDYASAAQAWMVIEMTKEMIRHREECISIAEEYQRRLADEQNTGTERR